jgi:AcrR family transcriptional regulator
MTWKFVPAPPRGHYDRRQPRELRVVEQRDRLIAATALAFARESAPTIATVVNLARVSRNTFYEYFDDLEHARAAAVLRAKQRVEQALRQAEQAARTPVERRRALARAWFDWIVAAPAEAGLILRATTSALGDGGTRFEAAVMRSLADARALGVSVATPDRTVCMAVAAAAEAFGRELVAMLLGGEADQRGPREVLERSLVDVSLRLLR